MVRKEEELIMTTIRVPKSILNQTDALVKTRDGGRALFIREAIREKLAREQKRRSDDDDSV